MELKGWNEFDAGACLFSFSEEISEDASFTNVKDRKYSENNSYQAYVGDWRVLKPIFNRDLCTDCQNCWTFCPDMSIVSNDKIMEGVDYDHCKGCGICVDVCPTNPKSLLMFSESEDNEKCLANWPEKEKKEK
jgi:pyruvate ferredoxin oxidoreductase delta subunit